MNNRLKPEDFYVASSDLSSAKRIDEYLRNPFRNTHSSGAGTARDTHMDLFYRTQYQEELKNVFKHIDKLRHSPDPEKINLYRTVLCRIINTMFNNYSDEIYTVEIQNLKSFIQICLQAGINPNILADSNLIYRHVNDSNFMNYKNHILPLIIQDIITYKAQVYDKEMDNIIDSMDNVKLDDNSFGFSGSPRKKSPKGKKKGPRKSR